MKSQIEQIIIPTTQRTLGSEKAVKSVAEDNGSLKRTFTTDFETYMLDGLPRIYVGVEPPEAA